MRNLTLKQLKAVQAIAGQGKIVNAAKVLGLSPPAVTIQLRQLEEEVGLSLFDRTAEACVPLPQGWPSSTPRRRSRSGCGCSRTRSTRSRACAPAA